MKIFTAAPHACLAPRRAGAISSAPMSLTPGARLGAFELKTSLGAGGIGEVYRARDTKLGREVALKILPDSWASDPDRLARFQREAQVQARRPRPVRRAPSSSPQTHRSRRATSTPRSRPTSQRVDESAAPGAPCEWQAVPFRQRTELRRARQACTLLARRRVCILSSSIRRLRRR